MINKLIIFGSTGMLGQYIHSYFIKNRTDITVIALSRKDCDALTSTAQSLTELLQQHQINENTLIFNAIGLIPQAAKNGISTTDSDYNQINNIFPQMLVSARNNVCKQTQMIHPTTDCVFSGKKGMYTENDLPDEEGNYGLSKAMADATLECTVIRTSIIGEEIRNKRSLIEWVKSNANKTIKGFTHHLWNGITCLQYAKLVEYLINNNSFWHGIRHIASPNVYSKYDLVQIINTIYNLNITVEQFTESQLIDKTLTSIYDLTPYNIPDLKEQIKELHEFIL